jgi:hypothetical protein
VINPVRENIACFKKIFQFHLSRRRKGASYLCL